MGKKEKNKFIKFEDMWVSIPKRETRKFYDELSEVCDSTWELIKKIYKNKHK
ncbi:MAG: hypothetical protein ACFFD2_15255 [Promethearchaeota archaeon]